MAKRMTVKVEGLSELRDAPGWLDHAQRNFLDKASTRLRDEVRKRAPGGPGGSAARDVRARTETSTRAVIESAGWVGARPLNRGAYIRPKRRGGVLVFTVGGRTVFTRRPVRLPARRYYEKGLRGRGRIIREVYSDAFNDVKASA